jgi:hypothetical protein
VRLEIVDFLAEMRNRNVGFPAELKKRSSIFSDRNSKQKKKTI